MALSSTLSPIDGRSGFSAELEQRRVRDEFLAKEKEERAKHEAFLGSIRRPYAEYKKIHPQGTLCHRCADVEWPLLLFSEASHYCETGHQELFRVPESSQKLSASTCPLCLLLCSDRVFEKDPDRALVVHCVCRRVSYSDHHDGIPLGKRNRTQHAPIIELYRPWKSDSPTEPNSYILQDSSAATQGYLLRKLDSGVIDYKILGRWLEYCKHHHLSACIQTFNSSISGLRVIDCSTEEVVAAPGDCTFHYVALSYVWGGTQTSGKDQDDFPATIRDAITVTTRLGYRYLWVDQYVRSSALVKVFSCN